MSLREEYRVSLVKLEIEKAERTFAEHEGLVEKGYWSTLANRLYYALFHAVSAYNCYYDVEEDVIKAKIEPTGVLIGKIKQIVSR